MSLGVCRECGQSVSTEATKCPHCGVSGPTMRSQVRSLLTWLVPGVLLLSVCGYCLGGPKKESATVASSLSATRDEAPSSEPYTYPPTMPQAEQDFCDAVKKAAGDYGAAMDERANELRLSRLRTKRRATMLKVVRALTVKDWIGTVSDLSTTGDGAAAVRLELPCRGVHIGTWNNSLSDAVHRTLIPQSSPLYGALEAAGVGARLRFSGRFFPDEMDGLRETSLTENGSMTDPAFVMKFRSVERL